MKINTDIDIDVADRDVVLSFLRHIPALSKDKESQHNVGVYFQNIPMNPLLGTASIDFKEAEELGYFKIDILNNSVYRNVQDEDHLQRLLNQEPDWNLLAYKEIVEELVHIHDYFDVVKKIKPKSIEQLAMVLAMIRPAKKHLIGEGWEKIEKEIWVKPENDEYYFKKPHGIAYAASIVVQLNQLVEECQQIS